MTDERSTFDTLLTWAAAAPGSETLLAPHEAAAFVSLARMLDFAGDSYYAECRLAGGRQLDLLVSWQRDNPLLAELPRRIDELERNATSTAQRVWRDAKTFIERWIAADDPLHQTVETLWFEFDDVLGPHAAAAPSLSACIVPNYGPQYQPGEPSVVNTAEALAVTYRALSGAANDESIIQRFGELTRALPEGGRLIHLSWMGARQFPAVKLYGALPRSRLPDYLTRIGFGGQLAALGNVLQSIATPELCGDDIYFDLNLNTLQDPLRCSFGIAFSQQQVALLSPGDPGRCALLEQLAAHDQCKPDQARALAAWAEPMQATAEPSWRDPRVRHWLDIKSVLDSRANLASKAYLGFAPIRSPFAISA
jgi:hypothetical protein